MEIYCGMADSMLMKHVYSNVNLHSTMGKWTYFISYVIMLQVRFKKIKFILKIDPRCISANCGNGS